MQRPQLLKWSLLVVLCLGLSSCYKWAPIDPPFEEAFADQLRREVRLTLVDGEQITLYRPQLTHDTIAGFAEANHDGWPDTMIPIDEVEAAENREAKTASTVGLVIGVIVGVGAIAFITTAAIVMGDPDY